MPGRLGAVFAAALAIVLVPAAAQAVVVADWKMDEDAGASIMVDSAGGDNNGTIENVVTGLPGLVPDGGKAYQFGGTISDVTVNNAANLNPGTRTITLTATVQVADGEILDDSYEVVRKGLVTTKGGDWKMEIKRSGTNTTSGKLHCVFKGVLPNQTKSLVGVSVKMDIVDSKVHTLQCIKTTSSVTAVVVGEKSASIAKAAGSISNDSPVIVGSKTPGDDGMQGLVDQVSVDIG